MASNPKHTFDFEALLTTKIDQANWRENKRKLLDAFGDIKIGIDEGMAKEDAQKVVDILNKGFEKAKMPKIDVSDFMDQIDYVAEKFTKALALINNIDTSALKNIEASLEHISDVIDEIAPKVGKNIEKGMKSAVLSVNQLDSVLGELGDTAERVGDALNFEIEGDVKKQGAALKKLKAEYEELENERIAAVKSGDREDAKHWLKRQEAMVKFVRTYESYMSGLKNKKDVKKEYVDLYNKVLPKSHDAKANLQNLIDRRAGTFSQHPESWAKEQTLKEVRDILKNGIKVEDSGKKKHTDTQPEPTPSPKKSGSEDPKGIKIYRGIIPPEEGVIRTRKENKLANGGGEFWTKSKDVATSYADQAKNGAILVDTITPKNKLVIDAGGHRFDEFLEMPGLDTEYFREFFDDILDNIKNGAYKSSDAIQAAINERAAALGHDVLEYKNIIDGADPNIAERSSTYAILDDSLFNDIKAFKQYKYDGGIGDYATRATKNNLPSYYQLSGGDILAEISNKIDRLATGENVSQAKDAIVSAVGTGWKQNTVSAETGNPLIDRYNKASEEIKQQYMEILSLQDQIKVVEDAPEVDDEKYNELSGLLDKAYETLSKLDSEFQTIENKATDDDLDSFYNRVRSDLTHSMTQNAGAAPTIQANINAGEIAAALADALKNINISHSTEVPEVDTANEQEQFKSLGSAIDNVTASINAKTQAFENEETVAKTAVGNEIATLNELEAKLLAIKDEIDTLFANAKLDEANSIDQYIAKLKEFGNEISAVKKAFKEVAKVIGQKNAGFIKGQKAVNAAIEAEQQAVEGLVTYVEMSIYDIVQDLKKLRTEFEKPLTFPEMDKANLNTVFDEIYRKFTELMDKVSSSGLNFDINAESITTAIKEALYAKDISDAGYRKVKFEDVFIKWDDDDWEEGIDFGSKRFTSEDDARKYFDQRYNGKFFNPNDWGSTKTLDKLITQLPSLATQTENWVQVIIRELQDDTGKVVQAIKLLLPKDIADNIDEGSLIQAFDRLTQSIDSLIANGGVRDARAYFEKILLGSGISDPNIANALATLGLLSESGAPNFKLSGDGGARGGVNGGVVIGDDVVYHTSPKEYAGNVLELMDKQNKAYELGANVPRILAAHAGSDYSFQLQARAAGGHFRDRNPAETEVWKATDEQIDRLLHTFEVLEKTGLAIEFGGDNVLFDEKKGFTLIDLANEKRKDHWDDQDTADGMYNSFMRHMRGVKRRARPEDEDKIDKLIQNIKDRYNLAPEDRLVNAQTVAQEKAAAAAQARAQKSGDDSKIVSALTDIANKEGELIAQEQTLKTIADKIDNIKTGSAEDMAAAMKEALYAKEIVQGGFEHLTSFDQVFTKKTRNGYTEYVNDFTGEVFDSLQSATNEFEQYWKGYWTDMGQIDGVFTGRQDQLIARFEADRETNAADAQNKWTQIIVEAITTQTGEIVEAIKLLIPQDVAESNGQALAQAFDTFINWVSEWSRNEWSKPGLLFQKMLNGYLPKDKNVLESLKTLGLISENNLPQFVLPGSGVRNLGVAVGNTSVVSTQSRRNVDNPAKLMELLNKANDMGADVPRILGMNESTIGHNGTQKQAVFFLQTLASGKNVTDHNTGTVNASTGFLDATDEQIDALLHTFEKIEQVGLYADFVGDNLLFDDKKGFSLIDLNTDSEGGIGTKYATNMVDQFLRKISWASNISDERKQKFTDHVNSRRAIPANQRLVNDQIIAERRKQQEELAKQSEANKEVSNASGGLDKGSLEEVLTSVFKNILNPQTQANENDFNDAPFARETTLDSVKTILEGIKAHTSGFQDGTFKIVPADDAVAATIDNDEAASNISGGSTSPKPNKQIDKMSPGGKLIHRVIVNTRATSDAFETDKIHFAPGSDGKPKVQLVEIIKDFDKLRKEERKNEQVVARAQKKVNEFVAKFESKTGGNARFVEGFSDLSNFTVTENNIDEAYNKMIELQKNYAKLETNFRKGQSSLNPFVNAMNRAQNIDNIFGDIDNKFKGLAYRSEELVDTFSQLEALSKEIHNFVERMNDPNAEPITPAEFTKFSEQMGDFIATKVKFDGIIRSDKDKNREAEVHNAQVETELIKGLVKLYERLGKAQATGNAEEASRLRSAIKAERDKLISVDYATDMRFKGAKEKGKLDAENAALREQALAIEKLNKLYFEYGELKEAAAFAGDTNLGKQLSNEASDKLAEINAARYALGDISAEFDEQFKTFEQAGEKKSRNNQLRAAAKKTDADEISRLSKIAHLEKEIGKLRAEADSASNLGVKAALEEEISIREQLIELQKEGRALDVESEAYFKQAAANDTREAKKIATEQEKEQVRMWKKLLSDDKKLKKRQAMTGKAGNAIGRAENVWIEAEGLDFDKLPAGFKKEIEEYYNKIDALRIKQHELNTTEVVTPEQRNQLISQTREVNNLTDSIGALVSEYQNLSGDNVEEINVANTLTTKSGIKDYENALKSAVLTHTNGKAQIKSFNAETKRLTYVVKTGAHEFTEYTAAVRGLDHQFVAVQGSTKRTETFLEATKRKMGEIASYMSGMSMLSRAAQELRKGIQYVREIDLALTELKKVTDETEETYRKFLNTASKTAEKVGSTIKDVVSSTADWARLGYSMEQAAKFAETTQILMNVSEFTDVSQATDTLISAVQAFGYTAETSMDVVDLLNTIGNNYAISTADLAQSLTKSSASLVAAGGDLAEAAALTATAM